MRAPYEFHPEIRRPTTYPEPARPVHAVCYACGDPCIGLGPERQPGHIKGKWYCVECYEELAEGKIDSTPARLFSAGAGCPLEYRDSDDPSPWEENNIQILEDQISG